MSQMPVVATFHEMELPRLGSLAGHAPFEASVIYLLDPETAE